MARHFSAKQYTLYLDPETAAELDRYLEQEAHTSAAAALRKLVWAGLQLERLRQEALHKHAIAKLTS